MKTITAIAKTYRGVTIMETMNGFLIFDERNRPYEFITWNEAKAFVDAWIISNQKLSVLGEMPVC